MASQVYGRRYSLRIAQPELVTRERDPAFWTGIYGEGSPPEDIPKVLLNWALTPSGVGATFDYSQDSEQAPIEFTDHQMQATISYQKDVKSATPQKATISIFNISKDTQDKIREEGTIQLFAGYDQDGDNLPMLFLGQIVKKDIVKKGVNTVTTLTCGDSYTLKKTFRWSGTFDKGDTHRQNLERIYEVAAAQGVPAGNKLLEVGRDSRLDRKSLKGWHINGKFFEQVNKRVNEIGYMSYTFGGKFYIEPKAVKYILADAIEVTGDNIKGSLAPLTDSTKTLSTQKDRLNGVKFSTFLYGKITPDKLITLRGVQDENQEGTYVISKLTHKLDFEGGKWDTDVECKEQKSDG